MTSPLPSAVDSPLRGPPPVAPCGPATVSRDSAVSWAAIVAGAAGAAALSLILLILGTGLGLSSVSPWAGAGLGATAFGVSTILWISFTQLAASGLGGYLAGRLRTRWTGVHTDEVYFRDTAHGFLAWAVASLTTAALLTTTIGSIVGTGVQAVGSAAGGAAQAAASVTTTAATDGKVSDAGSAYFVDALFRPAATAVPAASASAPTSAPTSAPVPATTVSDTPRGLVENPAEIARIFAQSLSAGSLSADDQRYVARRVAAHTGLSESEADKRVTDTFGRAQAALRDAATAAREAADKARKVSARAALWLFVSLLIGAFVASYAATFGGRQRDL